MTKVYCCTFTIDGDEHSLVIPARLCPIDHFRLVVKEELRHMPGVRLIRTVETSLDDFVDHVDFDSPISPELLNGEMKP